ncbi:hypothetical protein [Corallococcus macrosporus]|uniref:Lipoprotein n=1 Tax=Corallococcus macrosporus DSM 14697 TaxID=1189310 RepID=A0A250JN09_9BACT|nr:hypothetical protein [Corallococcus macrosporus]ATB44882.1 hypothetical protein MYMAC_000465 [Corallococcus macrosporus DSM 14697]
MKHPAKSPSPTPRRDSRRRNSALGALLALVAGACGGTDPVDPSPVTPDAGEPPVAVCPNSADNGVCLTKARLTYLDVRYDLSKPVFVNNRVPIQFGITSTSLTPNAPATRNVAVSFSFIEANPANPAEPIECASSAIDVDLVGDGQEQRFAGFIWPTSLCAALVDKTVNLRVTFDGDEPDTGIDYPAVTFTEAARGAEPNQACRTVADASAPELGRGCVYTFDIEPTPNDGSGNLIDVRYEAMEPDSSVAVLPYVAPGATEEKLAPSLVVQSTLVVNGRDPYISGLVPEEVPPELEADAPGITEDLQFGQDPSELGALTAMPGRATLRYAIAPEGTERDWLPLTVGALDSETGRVDEVIIEHLQPGTANTFAHELFAEGDTRAALREGGAWADVSDFAVRGCFVADFAQEGNEGEADTSDCHVLPVVLVRETPDASAATSIGFNQEFTRKLGNSNRMSIGVRLLTQNTLDRAGAASRIEGAVELEGKLGRSYSVTIARAVGQATLGVDPGETGYEITVDAFNQRVHSFAQSAPSMEHEEEFSAAKSFAFPGLGFGFGPVRVGFKISLGGEVGLTTNDSLSVSTDPARCGELLQSEDALGMCGAIARTITPGFNFTASIEGGINVRIVKAAVVADLKLVNTDFPLTASLAFGQLDNGNLVVLGNANWELGMQLIRGDVSIVGRVGIRRFSRTLRVHLFSFSSRRFSQTLLDRSMDFAEVLE